MTVKATLAYGKSFHFYHDALDNNHVYLELEDVPYDVGYRRVMVAIPIDVWEVIRALGAASLSLVNASDIDLSRTVESKVDERIAEYGRAVKSSPEDAEKIRFRDSVIFGDMNAPREQQVARGIEYYSTERERQRGVSLRMSQHKIIGINSTLPDDYNT
jgi:hypothetical protein